MCNLLGFPANLEIVSLFPIGGKIRKFENIASGKVASLSYIFISCLNNVCTGYGLNGNIVFDVITEHAL